MPALTSMGPEPSEERPEKVAPDLPVSPSKSAFKTSPRELVGMFPTTAMYVERDQPGWVDLHRAAARLRHDLGIRTGTWVDALDQLGPGPRRPTIATLLLRFWRPVVGRKLLPPDRARRAYPKPQRRLPP